MEWRHVKREQVDLPTWGWTRDDDAIERGRLEASLRAYGQVQAVVVRQTGDRWEVVAGRRLYKALVAVGIDTVMVADLGAISQPEAMTCALALEQRGETQYSRLAEAVATVVAAGSSVDLLATRTPFTPDRLRYFVELTQFDWSTFKKVDDGQQSMFAQDDSGEPGNDTGTLW